MLTTTLNRIREHKPCKSGWEKLLKGLGKTIPDDEPLPYAEIVRINGLDDALWCCRCEKYDREWRSFAVWCARSVQHLMTDNRSITALDVAERFANGEASPDELKAARAAADAAAYAAYASARAAAWAAAYAAYASARAAAWAAAGAAADAADSAAYASARAAAGAAARNAQEQKFLEIVS